ncbi:hypothetical protein [Desmonostoc muscorum]|nr:hypothetical protein [Desmonostoc muscorum]
MSYYRKLVETGVLRSPSDPTTLNTARLSIFNSALDLGKRLKGKG